MNTKSILTKTIAVTALSLAGITAININTNNETHAAIVQNDATVYTVKTNTTVYNSYENGQATGQILAVNTSWKVIKTAYDAQGNKWYDLGKNQWVKVNQEVGSNTTNQNSVNTQAADTNTSTQAQTKQNASTASGSEASAKAWIASQESGGSYSASNGQYVGKYQLSASYLHGDYSAANQERTADNYVKSRYGSWTAAKSFWQTHGWY